MSTTDAADTAADLTSHPPCRLISGGFAWLVQFVLFASAGLALLIKWQIENPRRPTQVWFLDVSKQAFGAGFAHILNIVFAKGLAVFTSEAADECAWYFINFTADTVFGTVLTWLQFKLLECMAYRCRWKRLMHSGEYGNPPDYCIWLVQVLSFTVMVFNSKGFIAGFLYAGRHKLNNLGLKLAYPFRSNPQTELIIVMVVCPLLMNCCQFWLFDSVLKGNVTVDFGSSRSIQMSVSVQNSINRLVGRPGYAHFRSDDPIEAPDAKDLASSPLRNGHGLHSPDSPGWYESRRDSATPHADQVVAGVAEDEDLDERSDSETRHSLNSVSREKSAEGGADSEKSPKGTRAAHTPSTGTGGPLSRVRRHSSNTSSPSGTPITPIRLESDEPAWGGKLT